MLYLDSNVFVYSALNRGQIGNKARSLIREIQGGKMLAASSALTFDELVWAVKKYRSLDDAIIAGEAFLGLQGLKLVDVTEEILSSALTLMRKYRINPRDSIHGASALRVDAESIVTADKDFDRVEEIQRRPI